MRALDLSLAKPLALVRPADLYELFDQVVGVYAFIGCAYIGRPSDGPNQSLSVEFSVRIQGVVRGTLVLRASLGAARLLAEGLRSHGHADDADSVDAFCEVTNLFVGHLLSTCLGGHKHAFEPFLPCPSSPRDWPLPDPDAACALLLETEPVEIRYWQEPGD